MNKFLEKIAEELEKEASIAGVVRRGVRNAAVLTGRPLKTGKSFVEGLRGAPVDVKSLRGTQSIRNLESHVAGGNVRNKVKGGLKSIGSASVIGPAAAGVIGGAAGATGGIAYLERKRKNQD